MTSRVRTTPDTNAGAITALEYEIARLQLSAKQRRKDADELDAQQPPTEMRRKQAIERRLFASANEQTAANLEMRLRALGHPAREGPTDGELAAAVHEEAERLSSRAVAMGPDEEAGSPNVEKRLLVRRAAHLRFAAARLDELTPTSSGYFMPNDPVADATGVQK